jgi:hypothetical protein
MVDALALDALCELCRHARVHFHRCAVLCLLQYSHSQISCTRPNFKDFIRRAEIGLYGQISSRCHRNSRKKVEPFVRF